MSIDHAILGVISLYPASGYDIKVEFEIGGAGLTWALGFGSIYPRLAQLERDGLVEVKEVVGEGRKKKIYELTSEGWEELSKWLAQPPAYPLPMHDELLLKMGFWGAACPEDRETLVEHLRQRRVKAASLLTYLREWPENGVSSISEYGMLVIKYARARLEAELAWIDEAIPQLQGPPQGPVQDPRGLVPRQQERRKAAFGRSTRSPRSSRHEQT